jgi:hypothetical protein
MVSLVGGPVKTFFLLHTLVAQVTTGPARLPLRPIRFAGGVGGHAAALDVAKEAQRRGVRRLVFARIWQAAVRALDAGDRPPFGEIGRDGEVSVQEAVSAAARWVAGRVEPELRAPASEGVWAGMAGEGQPTAQGGGSCASNGGTASLPLDPSLAPHGR